MLQHCQAQPLMAWCGVAGSKAAQRLAAEGFQVTAWNRNAAKAEALVEMGLDFKAAQHEAVEECDVAVLFLADADAIESILFSNDRALAALRGKTVLQMGTIGESHLVWGCLAHLRWPVLDAHEPLQLGRV